VSACRSNKESIRDKVTRSRKTGDEFVSNDLVVMGLEKEWVMIEYYGGNLPTY
jgi:hypothetical protein